MLMGSTKNNDNYIVFWTTKEENLTESNGISILEAILKIVRRDDSVKKWGRCESLGKNTELCFTGFALMRTDDLDTELKKYEGFIKFTGKYRYSGIREAQNLLNVLKKQ